MSSFPASTSRLPLRAGAGLIAACLAAATPAFADCSTDLGQCQFPRWDPAGAASFDRVGDEVDVLDDVAAVGAPGSLAVYVYVRTDGTWAHADTLTPPPGSSGEGFGLTIDITPERIFVGAPFDDTFGPETGAVYLYRRSATDTWTIEDKWTADIPLPLAHFGWDVDSDGIMTAIGTPDAPGGGAVHIWSELGGAPWEAAVLQEPGTMSLGHSVALDGDRLLAGDPYNSLAGPDAGAVYFYEITLLSSTFLQLLIALDAAPDHHFGFDVALETKSAVIGAPGHDNNGPWTGAAYVYDYVPVDPPTLQYFEPVTRLVACDGMTFDAMGIDVDILGNRIISGAPQHDDRGAAFVFRRDAAVVGGWDVEGELMAVEGTVDALFGTAVAIQGDHPLVGARYADGADTQSGAAYLFSLSGTTSPMDGRCPCETIATDVQFGAGKPGSFGVPQLRGVLPPVLGETTSFAIEGGFPGGSAWFVLGLVPGVLPFDLGQIYMADPIFIALPPMPPADELVVPMNLPLDPTLCGVELLHQVLIIDPGAAGAKNTAQTNGLRRILGS